MMGCSGEAAGNGSELGVLHGEAGPSGSELRLSRDEGVEGKSMREFIIPSDASRCLHLHTRHESGRLARPPLSPLLLLLLLPSLPPNCTGRIIWSGASFAPV